MPIDNNQARAAQTLFERSAKKLADDAKPRKRLDPVLKTPQTLARLSPQPDRLVAVKAAPSPIFEAALPLLRIFANMPVRMTLAEADVLHSHLLKEIPLFQSVCQDARMRHEYTLVTSYALCTALDEAASEALGCFGGSDAAIQGWAHRQLAIHFHGDGGGGVGVFRFIGWLNKCPEGDIDLLELMFIILRHGFEGMYPSYQGGLRVLQDMRRELYTIVETCRKNGPPHLFEHWQQIERTLKRTNETANGILQRGGRPA